MLPDIKSTLDQLPIFKTRETVRVRIDGTTAEGTFLYYTLHNRCKVEVMGQMEEVLESQVERIEL